MDQQGQQGLPHRGRAGPTAGLEQLPVELQDAIISFLYTGPPSSEAFNYRPNGKLLGQCLEKTLKSLSCCSSRLRTVTLPHLFRYASFRLERLGEFLQFVSSHGLEREVESAVVLVSQNDGYGVDKVEWLNEARPFARLFDALPLISSLTLQCATASLGSLTNQVLHSPSDRTFDMPYHNVRLEKVLARAACDYRAQPSGEEFDGLDKSVGRLLLDEQPFTVNPFNVQPWTSLSVNEGSFLRAYTQYEYYMRKPISILVEPSSETTFHLPRDLLRRLDHFAYTAIFPFYNHFSSVMSFIESEMPNLHTLTLCLSPDPSEYDTVAVQETQESSGKIDFNDPWTELETAYDIAGAHVRYRGEISGLQRLRVIRSIDWTFGGEIQNIVQARFGEQIESLGGWEFVGEGSWKRKARDIVIPEDVGPELFVEAGSSL